MRSRSSYAFLLATLVGVAQSQSFPDEASLPGCGQTCLDQVISQTNSFGCTDGSAGCLCAAANFQNGVHDCAAANCAADLLPSVTNYLIGVCATAVVGAPTSTAPVTTSAAPATTSTPPATTSVPPTSTPAASTPAVSTSPTSTIPSTTSTAIASAAPSTLAASTTSANATLPAAAPTTSSTGTTSASSTAGGSAVVPTSATSSSSTAAATATASPGLSVGAKAGIGIGAAVGAVAVIAAIVTCVIARKHKSRATSRSYKISEPMPGAGRIYANDNHSQGFKHSSELEMTSRRYEDMVPRHVPRNMV